MKRSGTKKGTLLFSLLLTLLIVALAAAGCGASTGTSEQSSTTAADGSSSTSAPVSVTQAQAGEKTVTDMAGREVTLPAQVESIATFGSIGVLNAMVETMGAGDKIVNEMSASFTKSDQWKYQYVFAPQIAQGPVFEDANREIQIEAVLQAAPDLSLCMTKETATLLESKGLNVLYLEWKTLDDVEPCITLLGEALGQEAVAADYLEWFQETVAEAEALAAGVPEAGRKTVLYGNVTSYTQPHIIAEWWITEAGGISVTEERPNDAESYEYTAEDLLQWNPDVMIVTSAKMVEEIKADARLADITAVKDNAIYVIPTVAHVWGNRTPEQPLTVLWTMNKLYPDILPTGTLAEEISYFYSHFFQTELTDDQIAEIIG